MGVGAGTLVSSLGSSGTQGLQTSSSGKPKKPTTIGNINLGGAWVDREGNKKSGSEIAQNFLNPLKLGGIFDGGSGDDVYEPFPGYLNLAGDLTSNIRGRIGKMGTLYGDAGGSFNLNDPAIESQYENLLSSQMGNVQELGSLIPAFAEAQQGVYDTQKQRLSDSYDDQRARALERYNRLGVATSTPGTQGLMDIDASQAQAELALAAELAADELQYNLDVESLANDTISTLGSQATSLSGLQTARDTYENEMTYDDWLRAYNEDYLWSSLASGLIGGSDITMQQQDSGADLSAIMKLIGAFASSKSGS